MTVTQINERSNHIRRLDISHDLNQIADLIEMCFPIHLDPDGQIYIQKMRKAAREMNLLGWLSPWTETADFNAAGFVWEEDNRIMGNLSLIPFRNEGHRTYLIANVAVHPTYRRKGIAQALTQRAVSYLRRRNSGEVWLQVREDNQGAQALYRSVGFTDRVIRTTWRIRPCETHTDAINHSRDQNLRCRKASDWLKQKDRLERAYPNTIRWNYPLDFNHLSPGIFQYAANLVEGIRLRHWTYDLGERGQGQISWQKTDTFANNLWLAFDESQEPDLLPGALLGVFTHLSQNHPISIDYPMGRAEEIFDALGFKTFRTLIWMACRL